MKEAWALGAEDDATAAPMLLDHIRHAPEIFRIFWTTTSALTLLTLFVCIQHVWRLFQAGSKIRSANGAVFLPPLATLYMKTFVFFPLCSVLSWASLLLLRFGLMLQLLLNLYEVGCFIWFWEIMSNFLNGPEAAFQVLSLASSMDPIAIKRLVLATTQMQAELESPGRSATGSTPRRRPERRSARRPAAAAVLRFPHGGSHSHLNNHCYAEQTAEQNMMEPKTYDLCDDTSAIAAWLAYLRRVRLGPYRVLAALPFCWLPCCREERSFTQNDLRLSRYLVVQYGVVCIVTVLARAVLIPAVAVYFQIAGFCSLVLSMYGLLVLLLATRRIVPRAEIQLELKFAVIKCSVFVVKGAEIALRLIPVTAYPPLYSSEIMRSAWMFAAVNWAAMPLAIAAARVYDPVDITRRYTSTHHCRSGLLVDLLLRLERPQTWSKSRGLDLLFRSLKKNNNSDGAPENPPDEEEEEEDDLVVVIRSLTPKR